jgi:hypothetical protein
MHHLLLPLTPSRRIRPPVLTRRAVFALACFCAAADAAQWEFKPSVDIGSMYDDNIGLSTGDHQSTSGYLVVARTRVESKTERSKVDLDGTLEWTDYRKGDVEDKSEQRLRGDWQYLTSERGTLDVGVEYRRDAIFETVIGLRGTGDVRDTDVALSTDTRVRRNYQLVNPAWRWLLTERSSVRIAYRLTEVEFRDEEGTSLRDYDDRLTSGTYTYALTERDSVSATVNLANYRPEGASTRSRTRQLLGGFTRKFSENTEASVGAGVSRTTETDGSTIESSTGGVASVGLRQTAEQSTIEGVVSRDVTPSGIGRTLQSDQLRVYWSRYLSETIEFVLNAQLLRQRSIEDADASANRRYTELSPQLRWHWLEDLQVVSSYRYRRQRYDTQMDSAKSRAVFLGISYSL